MSAINESAIVALLKACAKRKDLTEGMRLHAQISRSGLFEHSTYIANTLVSMYSTCGAFVRAHRVLDDIHVRNVVSWNALITGHANHGQAKQAFNCLQLMQCEGIPPNTVTFTCILKACASAGAVNEGEQIHHRIVTDGLLRKNIALGTALVDMYCKCGALDKAKQVLDELPARNVVSWSALIAGFTQSGQGKGALECFERMQCSGIIPDAYTFTCVLKACGSIGAVDKGEEIHGEILKQGLLGKHVVLDTALVDMYSKCGALTKAQGVHDLIPIKDVITWGALLAGYVQHGHAEEALNCFRKMQHDGVSPDGVTFACVLKACGKLGRGDMGEQIHDEILKRRLLEKDIVLGAAVVDMYVKCGALLKAQAVIKELPLRNVVTWNTLVSGYVQQGKGKEALDTFECMKSEGCLPDRVTFICILKACGIVGIVEMGEEIHQDILKQRLLATDMVLGTCLVDMYVKCGALMKAQEVLEELSGQDTISRGAQIAGYATQGQSEQALNCFNQMQSEGLSQSVATLSGVLNACGHSGLLDEGEMHFAIMDLKYGITPVAEHHACMVDLFARAGDFDKALSVIKEMPFCDYLPIWISLLGACCKWGNVNLGRSAFERVIQIDKNYGPAYICMTNIYADAGMQKDADEIEAMRVENEAWMEL